MDVRKVDFFEGFLKTNMDHIDIEISLSRGKLLMGVLGSVLMISASVFIWWMGVARMNLILKGIAILGGGLFSIALVFWVKKFFDFKPGLVLNKKGILDNSNSISVGLIPWYTITGIGERAISSQKLILVYVSNPKELMEQQTFVKRRFLKGNFERYGTPVAIISNTLDCSYSKLYELLVMEVGKYGKDG